MVNITFYSISEDRRTIYKTLGTPIITTTAELYDSSNILNPELKLAWDNKYASSANYFYIQQFNRYYFIEDVIAEPGGAARIKGSIDVLYTYHESLEVQDIVITRAYESRSKIPTRSDFFNSGTGPTYVKDPQYPLLPNREIRTYEFKQITPFNLTTATNSSPNFVLNIMGRSST